MGFISKNDSKVLDVVIKRVLEPEIRLYKEICDGEVVTIEQHKKPILKSEIKVATEQEIADAKEYYNKHGKCEHHHLFYDVDGFMYYERYCGICGEFISLI